MTNSENYLMVHMEDDRWIIFTPDEKVASLSEEALDIKVHEFMEGVGATCVSWEWMAPEAGRAYELVGILNAWPELAHAWSHGAVLVVLSPCQLIRRTFTKKSLLFSWYDSTSQ